MDENFIMGIKKQLEAEKTELVAQIKPKFQEIGSDEDDQAMEVEAYDTEVAMSVEAKNRIKQIDEALKRIADGVYGVCEKCGKPIEKERLEVEATAVTCVNC